MSTGSAEPRASRRPALTVALAAVSIVLVGAAAAPAAVRRDPPPPTEPEPFSGISQYVEELPVAGGTVDVSSGAKEQRTPVPSKTRTAIRRSGGKDATALTRIVAPSSSAAPPREAPTASTPAAPRQASPSAAPRGEQAAIARAQREELRRRDPAPVSGDAAGAALDSLGGTDARLLALAVGLVVLTLLAAAAFRRGRSPG